MKTALTLFLSAATLAAAPHPAAAFEQIASSDDAWRTRGAGSEMLVFPEGFALRSGTRVLRFRWDRALHLDSLKPESILPSHTYALSGAIGKARELAHAERIRATGEDAGLSILYYFGPRGLEFDLETSPGVISPNLRLESADADFSRDALGRISIDGRPFALQPVAYTEDSTGRRSPVAASYRLESPRTLTFEIGPYRSDQRLVVDPVVTYATYFSGSLDDSPLAVREMPDGTVLIAGNTQSIDLPMGVSLNTTLMEPPRSSVSNQCFVARLSTADKLPRFVSYFGGGGSVACSSMDLDSSGRILLAGGAYGSPLLTTANAEHATPNYQTGIFLARISADGRTVEYATYLDVDPNSSSTWLKAGPSETAYMAVSCTSSYPCVDTPDFPGAYQTTPASTVLLRYNIAARHFDQKTYLTGFSYLSGLEVSPAGGVYLFGSAQFATLPLKNAFQTAPPSSGWTAGAIAAVSVDFRDLLLSSYLGGQNLHTNLTAIVPATDGSVWLTGLSYPGSIPGLQSVKPDDGDNRQMPFAVQAMPGVSGLRKAFTARGYDLSTTEPPRAVLLPAGPFCITTQGFSSVAFPGGAATGNGNVGLMGCLNDAANDFQMITPTGSFAQGLQPILVTPSAAGGIWSFQLDGRGGFGDAVPYELKAAAIQPLRPYVTNRPDSDDLILRYIDLKTPNPVLTTPQPVNMYALQANTISSLSLAGRNFALGMRIKIGDTTLPLAVSSAATASARYSPTTFALPAGTYMAQLVIPTQPQPAVSDSFQVIVNNLVPAPWPFTTTSSPRTFNVAQPVYRDSQVLWNGVPIPYNGGSQVQIPADLSPPGIGELTLVNQRPGGGVQRQAVTIGATSSTIPTPDAPTVKRISAEIFQVDRARKLLYLLIPDSAQWTLASYSLPDGTPLHTTTIPRNSASSVVDFRISTDGAFLYFTDDRLRVVRFRAATLAQDFEFQIPRDAPPADSLSTNETRHRLRVLEDSPEALLVVTPAGRMILYDRDQPRPYTSGDFPSAMIDIPYPVLVTATYVYSVRSADVYHPVPCVSRHPIDALGFGPPEDICNIGNNWDKYPEMKIYGGALLLESRNVSVGLLMVPDNVGNMLSPYTYDNSRNLGIVTAALSFDFNTRATTYRLAFVAMDTGAPVGHYPARTPLAYATAVVIIDDDTMVYLERPAGSPNQVTIVPNWQTAMERYP
jgi:hypothetical protein